jgi:hypothetical protein
VGNPRDAWPTAALELVAGLVAMGACGTEPTKGSAGAAAGTSEKAPPYAPDVAEENAATYAPQIDPSSFVEKIDNRYMPLTPGNEASAVAAWHPFRARG